MAYRVGVDIGGTFTDFCAFDEETNALHTLKVLSTPDEPGAEVMQGIEALRERYGVAPESIAYFTHGTTVGVNTVIQRKGIRLCLFTTRNFVDVLEVARSQDAGPLRSPLDTPRPPGLQGSRHPHRRAHERRRGRWTGPWTRRASRPRWPGRGR